MVASRHSSRDCWQISMLLPTYVVRCNQEFPAAILCSVQFQAVQKHGTVSVLSRWKTGCYLRICTDHRTTKEEYEWRESFTVFNSFDAIRCQMSQFLPFPCQITNQRHLRPRYCLSRIPRLGRREYHPLSRPVRHLIHLCQRRAPLGKHRPALR